MFLTIPYVLAVDESPAKNVFQQIAARAGTFEGTLSNFTSTRLRGWLFHPADGGDEILIVPSKTTPARIPVAYTKVLRAEIDDGVAQRVDLAAADWLRHPQL